MKTKYTDLRRKLRKSQTDAESKLWSILRDRQLAGVKFRRQHSVGMYILDFYCPAHKIGIEADGKQHYDNNGKRRDEARTRTLSKYGIRVIRFSDLDILNNIEAVSEAIYDEIKNGIDPSPCPLPASRGEGKCKRNGS